MATEDDWAAYGRAVIDIAPPGRASFRLVPDVAGVTDAWPDGLAAPVVVVTAWNPDSVVLPAADNRARNRRLVAELDRRGVEHWPAVGRDPGGRHVEEGVAVPGMGENEGVAFGARHGQAAIYLWSPDALAVVSCTLERRLTIGWRCVPRSTDED